MGAVSMTEGKYSVELFKEGGEGAGQEEIIRAFGWPESALPESDQIPQRREMS